MESYSIFYKEMENHGTYKIYNEMENYFFNNELLCFVSTTKVRLKMEKVKDLCCIYQLIENNAFLVDIYMCSTVLGQYVSPNYVNSLNYAKCLVNLL